jgi:DNA helicase-2/ATP-dependent DNA helicase PcrA
MQYSKNQQVVLDTVENTEYNILIEAVAGGAKTSTLLAIVEKFKKRVLFLAFNKSIQEEISAKLTERNLTHAKAMTIHSLGLAATRLELKNVHVNNNKNWELVATLEKQNKSFYKKLTWKEKYKINMTIMTMNDASRLYFVDELEDVFEAMEEMDKMYFVFPELEDLWKEFLQIREYSYHQGGPIDFIDMVYYPVKAGIYIPVEPFYLLIDEAQDLNLCQHLFIDKLLDQGNIIRWVAVGDRNQAIYGFGGSFSSSFDKFKTKENVVELPLDICYRCPTKIIEQANQVYDVMKPFKTTSGIVETITDAEKVKDNSMVICRNSAPLFSLYFILLSHRKRVYIKGEEVLSAINRFLKPYLKRTVEGALREMQADLKEWESVKETSKDARFRYYKFRENLDIFMILIKNIRTPYKSVEDLTTDLLSIFSAGSEQDTIILSTIHKSKGLEHPVVYILNEFLIPSEYATTDRQLEQERNLKYVARTRATEELYYLNLKI